MSTPAGGGTVINCQSATTAQMEQQATFTAAGWNFSDVWTIQENVSSPTLRGVGKDDGTDRTPVPGGVLTTTNQWDGIHVAWNSVAGATAYRVYRAENALTNPPRPLDDPRIVVSDWVNQLSFVDATAVPGVEYYYWVKAAATIEGANESDFSSSVSGQRTEPPLNSPASVVASNNATNQVALVWDPVANGNYYRVYRATSESTAKTALGTWQAQRTFVDIPPSRDTVYYYWVTAAVDQQGLRESGFGPYSTGTALSPPPSLSISNTSVSEGNSDFTNAEFTIALSAASAQDVVVSWATADGTATAADGDYQPASGKATIRAGQLTTVVTVALVGDTLPEADEYFYVKLADPINATVLGGQGRGTIRNDEPTPPTVTIQRAASQLNPTLASPINFTVVFSEPVSDFAAGDVSLTGSTAPGTLVATVSGSGMTYNIAVSGMTGTGTVVASVAAGVAHDAAGDPNLASTGADNSVTYALPNHSPTDITLSSTTVPENLPAGTTVGTLNTTDPDSDNKFTYTRVSDTGGTDNAWFTISEDALKTAAGFDYETKNSYSIRVRSTDEGGLSTEKTFTIYVTNGNEPPTLAPISNPAAILEDAPRQTVNLTGITAGTGESQALLVTATSSDPWLIPNPAVSYSSPKNIGSLTYTPVANQSGTATITVTVRDAGFDGTLGNADDGQFSRTFTVTVNPLNDLPTLDAIANRAAIVEDSGAQIVNLMGITAGGGESQGLQVTATSSNPGLIPHPTVNYNSAGTTGSLNYTPVGNQSGTATITVTVRDAGLDGVLGTPDDATISRSFTATVSPLNDQPTLDAISDPAAIVEDASAQTVSLTGITAGSGEAQRLQVTAASSNPKLIPNPTVSYASPGSAGILTYRPVANQSGWATITVTVRDAGLDGRLGNADDATLVRTFTVTVLPVNDVPTLNAISNPAAIKEDVGFQTVKLSGISAGAGELQALRVTATTGNPGLVNPTVGYSSPSSTAVVSYAPVANQSGSTTITVTVWDAGLDGILDSADDGAFSRTFTVTIVPVNDLPTLDVIPNPAAIAEDTGTQTVNLTGISAGGGESQALQVTATSNNSKLIPNPAISYSSADGLGSLSYTPVANQSGTAKITVTVRDAGLDGKLGSRDDALFSRTFTVTVISINDLPTLNAIADTAPILEGASRQTVNLFGISAGGGESQRLQVTATSSDPWLIPNPTVSYFSARSTGSLGYTPIANQSGSATITVTVQDAGLDGRLGNADDATFLRTFAVTVLPKGASLKLAAVTSIATSAGGAEILSQTDLGPIAEAAVALWSNAGLPKNLIQRLRQAHFVIADLPGSELGRATSDTIYIDTDAAGNSWFIDGSPLGNEEFATIAAGLQLKAVDRLATERVDLLTVVCHELGHIAGLDDQAVSSDGIMGGSLSTGTRRIARRAEVDAVFARGRLFG